MDINEKTSIFKSPTGQYRTKSLFLEQSYDNQENVYYTLKDHHQRNELGEIEYLSLHQLFLEHEDPLEYSFAETYLFSFDHWQTLCRCSWFKPFLDRWRFELELKIRSEALKRVLGESKTNGKNAFMATRYLVNGEWLPKETKGRPNKDQIKKEAVRIAEEDVMTEEDWKRIN